MMDDDSDEDFKEQPSIQINFNSHLVVRKDQQVRMKLKTQAANTPSDSFYDSFHERERTGPFKIAKPVTTKLTPKGKVPNIKKGL